VDEVAQAAPERADDGLRHVGMRPAVLPEIRAREKHEPRLLGRHRRGWIRAAIKEPQLCERER
jgi:hypothetical protein